MGRFYGWEVAHGAVLQFGLALEFLEDFFKEAPTFVGVCLSFLTRVGALFFSWGGDCGLLVWSWVVLFALLVLVCGLLVWCLLGPLGSSNVEV